MPDPMHSLIHYIRFAAGAWKDDPRDDPELLTRFTETHDETAFATLIRRHGAMVWRTCKSILGNKQDTEDAFQNVFLALARKAGQVAGRSPAGWLHKAARQTALYARRTATRRREDSKHSSFDEMPSKREEVDQVEQYAVLDEELANLPEKLRVPLVLRYLEEKTQEEVARILGCSRTAVQKRLEKGEAVLRKRMELRGFAFGVGSIAALLGKSDGIPTVPSCLIENTARAAVAFRGGALTGTAADGARKLLQTLAVEGARKQLWWVVLACIGFCGVGGTGFIVWKMYSDGSSMVTSTPASIKLPPPEPATTVSAPHTDCYGDPLPPGALARLGTMRLRHNEGSPSLFFTPDGKRLLTAGDGSPPRLWDVVTGKMLHELSSVDFGQYFVAALSPDGRILAVRNKTDNSLHLLETATGKRLQEFKSSGSGLAQSL